MIISFVIIFLAFIIYFLLNRSTSEKVVFRLGDTQKINNGKISITLEKLQPDLTMVWGGGPYAEFIFSYNNENEKHQLSYLSNIVIEGKRITLVDTDWENIATLKVENKYTKTEDCDWIEYDRAREFCYIDVVEKSLDIDDCYKIQNGNTWFSCISTLAPLVKDISVCDKLDDMPMRYRCYSSVAVTSKNMEICEETKDIPYYNKSDCYTKIAVENKNTEACEMIDSDNKKDNCYKEMAIKNKSSQYCEFIKDSKIKENCIYWSK